ncbi:MAG: hypothetical protein JWO86_8489 [Myxococcaceae bacterium]|nr:hypothetical protein [Myxococcaceae bacterium]
MSRTITAATIAGIALCFSLGLSTSSAHAGTAEPERDRPAADPKERSDDDARAFRIGAVAGVGFPHPLAIEALVKIDGVLALGAEYSALPKMNIATVEASAWAIAADARLFPFRNAFFVGVRGGRQNLKGTTTVNVGALGSFTESAEANAWFVNPRIGFLKTWDSGFTLGIDAGVQVPIGATLTSTLPAGVAPQADATMASVAKAFGNGVTPTVDILRVGFLF